MANSAFGTPLWLLGSQNWALKQHTNQWFTNLLPHCGRKSLTFMPQRCRIAAGRESPKNRTPATPGKED
jgi:hypothetical protein